VLAGPGGVEDADHVCWAYEDDTTFEDAALRFLGSGLDRGERLLWVGDGAPDRLRRSGGRLAQVEDLLARGALRVLPVAEAYGAPGTFSPAAQRDFYAAETHRALEDGYRGLRAVAEVSALAADADRGADFLRWEHLCDDLVASTSGLRVLCAYRTAEVPADVVADAAALHPVVVAPGTPPPFRLWFDGNRIAVSGEIDTAGADRFRRLVVGTHADGPVLTLDLGGVGFMDLAGARAVAQIGRAVAARDGRLVLTGTSRLFRRMWQILDHDGGTEVSFVDARP
jgi:anti-anti-sigma factor